MAEYRLYFLCLCLARALDDLDKLLDVFSPSIADEMIWHCTLFHPLSFTLLDVVGRI